MLVKLQITQKGRENIFLLNGSRLGPLLYFKYFASWLGLCPSLWYPVQITYTFLRITNAGCILHKERVNSF